MCAVFRVYYQRGILSLNVESQMFYKVSEWVIVEMCGLMMGFVCCANGFVAIIGV